MKQTRHGSIRNTKHFLVFSNDQQQRFSIKAQIVNIISFAGHMAASATIPLCPRSLKAATDYM